MEGNGAVLEPRAAGVVRLSRRRTGVPGTGIVARTVADYTGSALVEPQPDRELVDRAKAGDRGAREELAQRYRQAAFLLALQLLGNREDALDVAQEGLLKFFSHLDRFDSDRPVLPWLRRLVRNCSIDLHRRKKVRRADSLDSSGPEGSAVEVADGRVDTELSASVHQRQRVVWRCVQALAPAQREIIVLRDYQDLSYLEIAGTLDVPIGTVMSRLHRARAELRSRVLEQVALAAGRGATDHDEDRSEQLGARAEAANLGKSTP